jgi:hypothetical protein
VKCGAVLIRAGAEDHKPAGRDRLSARASLSRIDTTKVQSFHRATNLRKLNKANPNFTRLRRFQLESCHIYELFNLEQSMMASRWIFGEWVRVRGSQDDQ